MYTERDAGAQTSIYEGTSHNTRTRWFYETPQMNEAHAKSSPVIQRATLLARIPRKLSSHGKLREIT